MLRDVCGQERSLTNAGFCTWISEKQSQSMLGRITIVFHYNAQIVVRVKIMTYLPKRSDVTLCVMGKR